MHGAANPLSPQQKRKHQESDSKKLLRWKIFKYGHLEPFLWAHLPALTLPALLQNACMIITALLCSFIVTKVTVTSSGKALVKKKCNAEIMGWHCWELTAFPWCICSWWLMPVQPSPHLPLSSAESAVIPFTWKLCPVPCSQKMLGREHRGQKGGCPHSQLLNLRWV